MMRVYNSYFVLFLSIIVIDFIIDIPVALASNWAQVSGFIQQSITIPYYPSPGSPHFSPRYGMVSVATTASNISSNNFLFLMGGDSFTGDVTQRDLAPGLGSRKWEIGYQNDVWQMTGIQWSTRGDSRLRGPYRQKIPKVRSGLSWTQKSTGLHPPPGTTYQDWISCEAYFKNTDTEKCKTSRDVMWSPRRNHAGLYFNGYLWVFGGRAREFVDLPEERSVGGIFQPRVQDIPQEVGNEHQSYTTQREASVLKSDVWKSVDGMKWTLVTPGCRAPQLSLIASGYGDKNHPSKYGIEKYKCKIDADCYGDEYCFPKDAAKDSDGTCVCLSWSPREQHAVAAHGGYMYVMMRY